MTVKKVIVIGAGPAGLAAVIQLKRYGIDALLLEREAIGGLLRNANLVENYPGFVGGVSGIELVRLFAAQAEQTGVHVTFGDVVMLNYIDDLFWVETAERVYKSKLVVVATGTRARRLTQAVIPEDVHDRVLYEVHPLSGVTGKHVAIVGAGDAAFDYALNLVRHNQVSILNQSDHLKCLPLLWERAQMQPNIRYLEKYSITQVANSGKNRIQLSCRCPDGDVVLRADYLIGAIGRDPQLNFLSDEFRKQMDRLEKNGLLYLIGDVKNSIYRQTSIAVGDGVKAAMEIYQFLDTR